MYYEVWFYVTLVILIIVVIATTINIAEMKGFGESLIFICIAIACLGALTYFFEIHVEKAKYQEQFKENRIDLLKIYTDKLEEKLGKNNVDLNAVYELVYQMSDTEFQENLKKERDRLNAIEAEKEKAKDIKIEANVKKYQKLLSE